MTPEKEFAQFVFFAALALLMIIGLSGEEKKDD